MIRFFVMVLTCIFSLSYGMQVPRARQAWQRQKPLAPAIIKYSTEAAAFLSGLFSRRPQKELDRLAGQWEKMNADARNAVAAQVIPVADVERKKLLKSNIIKLIPPAVLAVACIATRCSVDTSTYVTSAVQGVADFGIGMSLLSVIVQALSLGSYNQTLKRFE